MKKIAELNDIIDDTNWSTNGFIFKKLQNMPWSDDTNINPLALDSMYLYNHSGMKLISPMLQKFTYNSSTDTYNKLSSTDIDNIISIIKSMFLTTWSQLWDAMTAEYNPVSNYDMIETETDFRRNSENDTTTDATTINVSTAVDSTVETEGSTEASNDANTFGFNTTAADGVPSAKNTGSTSIDSTVTTTDNTTTRNNTSSTIGSTIEGTNEGNRTLKRSGNIGVTTSQQMVESSIELAKDKYFKHIMNDLDSILTLNIY